MTKKEKVKRIISGLAISCLILGTSVMSGSTASADTSTSTTTTSETTTTPTAPTNKAAFIIGQKSYQVNGAVKAMDAASYIKNGRTYVPIRYLGYSLGVTDTQISWNAPKAGLTLNDTAVTLTVGSKNLDKNGTITAMDVSPEVKSDGRTYLPARFVAEAFGYEVGWDSSNNAVTVYPPSEEAPTVVAPTTPVVSQSDPTNPPIEMTDGGFPSISVETAQKLCGGNLVLPADIKQKQFNLLVLKPGSKDAVLNPTLKYNPVNYARDIVSGTYLKNFLEVPYGDRIGYYTDWHGQQVKQECEMLPLKQMLVFEGFPAQNIFWNAQTKTMVIYGKYRDNQPDRYSVIKLVVGQEFKPRTLVTAPILENGVILVNEGDMGEVGAEAFCNTVNAVGVGCSIGPDGVAYGATNSIP